MSGSIKTKVDIEYRALGPDEVSVLRNVAPGVFDNPTRASLVAEFLNDPRHHIVVAIEASLVVGFVSAVHYVNPDKPRELWVNEVSVAPTYQSRGIGRLMLETMLRIGRELNCVCAWVLTDRSNVPAMRLYHAAGGVEAPEPSILFEFELCAHTRDAD